MLPVQPANSYLGEEGGTKLLQGSQAGDAV